MLDPALPRVFTPSDLIGASFGVHRRLRVGGRIEWITGRELGIADAVGSIRLVGDFEDSTLAVGSLAVLVLERQADHFCVTAIEYAESFPAPRGDSEWARFAWGGVGSRLAARDRIRRGLRRWFEDHDFVETETPTLLRVPGLDSGVDGIAADGGWLVTSPELCMKRLLVGGLPRIYQFAKCFRRDELGPLHEPEFTMLEWYRGFAELDQILDDTEALVIAGAEAIGLRDRLVVGGRAISLERPFLRLTVDEAFRRHAGVADVDELAKMDRDRYFRLFVDRVEPCLRDYDRPVFLHAYPAVEAALARVDSEDPRWAERAELYIAGVELCNGYGELTVAGEQRKRFEAEIERRRVEGRPIYPLDEEFLASLEQGMPPAAGNALGFDRLVMLLLGAAEIASVVAFPSAAPR